MTTTVTIRYSDGTTRDVPAEPTAVPGLVVTPAGGDPAFKPEWRLTHGPSGTAFPYWGPTRGHVQSLARALAKVRPDWSDLPADPEEWPDGLREEANRVGGEWECRRHRLTEPRFFWPVAVTA
jgi:hypothetical protein